MKKYFSILLILPFIILIFFCSCDKIKPPYKENEGHETDTTSTTRKILLEEFTGHECQNCPIGSATAEQLKDIYGNNLILISIHAGGFAVVETHGDFTYDFTSRVGDSIHDFFHGNALGYPMGLISRTGWTQGDLTNLDLDAGGWGTRIETIKNDEPKLSIEITNSYNSVSRTVSSSIESDALMPLTATYKICAYLTEDSIIQPQQFADSISYHYIHRHVLRGALNSTFGDTLATGNTLVNAQFLKNYSLVLKPAWNESHCFVVSFIYDASNYEIMQVAEKRVK